MTYQNNKKPVQEKDNTNKVENKSYKTSTYTSPNPDQKNIGITVINTSKLKDGKNESLSKGRENYVLSGKTSNSRSNSKNNYKNTSITIIGSDKNKKSNEIINNGNNKYNNYGRTYVTNVNMRNSGNVKTEPNVDDNKVIARPNFINERPNISNTSNKTDKNYKYIPKDIRNNINKTYEQNKNNLNNNTKNVSNSNPSSNLTNNVFISSYTTKRIKEHKNDDKNKTQDLKYNYKVHYNTVSNKTDINKETKNNNEIKTIKDTIQKDKPNPNKGSNIGFISSNVAKNKIEQNKEKKNEPIVH